MRNTNRTPTNLLSVILRMRRKILHFVSINSVTLLFIYFWGGDDGVEHFAIFIMLRV